VADVDRLVGLIVVGFVVARPARGSAERLFDQLCLVMMVMNLGDKLIEVQRGERRRRIGGVHDRLQRMIGRHRLGDHRKKVVDLFVGWRRAARRRAAPGRGRRRTSGD
jgi:hypothetical protein